MFKKSKSKSRWSLKKITFGPRIKFLFLLQTHLNKNLFKLEQLFDFYKWHTLSVAKQKIFKFKERWRAKKVCNLVFYMNTFFYSEIF